MQAQQDITELIDDMNRRIAHLQTVREAATKEITQLIVAKHELTDTYMNSDKEV